MKVIENVVIVGDENVVRDLHYPKIRGKNGAPVMRCLIEPGGTKSAITGGERLCAFEEAGISAGHFNKGLFTSAAAWNGVAYSAKQSHLLMEYYQKISWLNAEVFWSSLLRGDFFGIEWLADELRGKFDRATFDKCMMDVTVAVSDVKAKVHLHKAKEAEDIFELLVASSALLPGVYGREINGVMSYDGGFTIDSTVIEWLKFLKHENPHRQYIDLLYIANRPHPKIHYSKVEERIFNRFVKWELSNYPELAQGALSIDGKLRKVAELFQRQRPRIRTCAIFPMPDENIYPLEWRKKILHSHGELTRVRTEKLLRVLAPKREI